MTIERPMFPPPLAAAPSREMTQLSQLQPSRQLATCSSPSANLPKVDPITSGAEVMPAEKVSRADYFESTDPEHSKRKNSEQVVFSERPIGTSAPRAETGRRGFLRGLAALLPLTAVAAQIAPAPAAANPVTREVF